MQLPHKTTPKNSLVVNFLLLSSSFCAVTILVSVLLLTTSLKQVNLKFSSQDACESTVATTATTIGDVVFGISSSESLWPKRKEYAKLWWNNTTMRGCVFVEKLPEEKTANNKEDSVIPLCVSEDTSRFRYTHRTGTRSAIRLARVVKETVALNWNNSGVRWYVFGDDDTVFFPRNLVKTLSKYDHRLWYYLGDSSERYIQNTVFGFGMAFGGGGLAISSSLARALAKVFDSCIERYPHLYGSDARVYSCITELGIELTHEPGFHQVDLKGNIFGLLAAHPLAPLLSLHHLDYIDPIFPNMTTIKALQHLFEAVNADSQRILQQTVCYDRNISGIISVSWGYAVQVFQGHMSLPDVLKVQHTFEHWRRGTADLHTLNTVEPHPDPCKRPTVFYMDKLSYGKDGTIITSYKKFFRNCSSNVASTERLEVIKVSTSKIGRDIKQLQSQRRQCCDVLPSYVPELMEIEVRECKEDELIYMH